MTRRERVLLNPNLVERFGKGAALSREIRSGCRAGRIAAATPRTPHHPREQSCAQQECSHCAAILWHHAVVISGMLRVANDIESSPQVIQSSVGTRLVQSR